MKSRPKTDSYRSRFGLTGHPLPRDACGKTFYDQTAGYLRLESGFQELIDEPGLGVLTAETGVGKTTAIRNLCDTLPEPEFKVVYHCDTNVTAFDLYRVLALELGLKPSHRRAQLWWDLKKAITHLVEERHTLPVVVLDEAQLLSDVFFSELSGFLNFAFDRKTLIALWLVGMPALNARLRMQHHAPLAARIGARVHLEPLGREDFAALVAHAFQAAGATGRPLTDSALEGLWRASHGVPRWASRLLRRALRVAHRLNKDLVDDEILALAVAELAPPQEKRS